MDRSDYQRAYREANKAALAAKKREYYYKNHAAIRAERNAKSETKKAYMVAWRADKAAHRKAYAAAYRAANADAMKLRQQVYFQANKERYRLKMKERYDSDPGAFLFNQINTRARRYGVECDLTRDEYDAVKSAHGGLCGMCHAAKKLTIDHIKPLSKGGPHTKGNIQFLCVSCNSRKGAKSP